MEINSGTAKESKFRLSRIWKGSGLGSTTIYKKKWHWYLVPSTVCLIGILSLIMLTTLHLVIKHQRSNSMIIDAIMGVETNAAIFHLGVEETVGGDDSWDPKLNLSAINQAIALTDGLLHNGMPFTNGLLLKPLPNRESRAHVRELKAMLIEFKQMGLLRERNPEESGSGTIGDKQFDAFFYRILEKASYLEHIYKTNREQNRVKSWNLFLGIYLAWSFVIVTATIGLWRIEMQRKRVAESLLEANTQLSSQTAELDVHRQHLAKLVEMRTAELTAANEKLRGEIEERIRAESKLKESENTIRQCSFRLIGAQEMERKRISNELHDGLGQALNVIKLRIRIIEQGLADNCEAARSECEVLQDYLNEVIDETRRLSLDLSPAILEDLGLTSALRWLINTFRETSAMEVSCEVADIDNLFPERDHISIYRVVQEALTNVGKHSRAGKVVIVIGFRNGDVDFSVQDDGIGFDLAQQTGNGVSKIGLGLASMKERVTMMGGVFHLWSRRGEGTKISFSIPVANYKA
jgi:signal transduction histidine kinase